MDGRFVVLAVVPIAKVETLFAGALLLVANEDAAPSESATSKSL
jgi:hypothetical protein